ncbi:MAG: tetratricopeptide repeat protein [Bacteroidales bacterium]|nr:tetratricopeptide repeat protein [Bacteroidales bacterium]
MKKLTLQLIAVVLVFALGGCGLGKMVDNANLIQYQVNPNPLEMHADSVQVEINVTFPAKYFNKKAYLVITPTIKSDNGNNEIGLVSQTLQGEKVKDNNPVIPYDRGGSFTYKDKIPYDVAYRMSDLELKIAANKGGNGKDFSFGTVKIGEGIITTPELVDEGLKVDNGSQGNTGEGLMRTVTPKVDLPKSRTEKQSLVLYYPVQKENLTSNEQKKSEIDEFLTTVKNAKENKDIVFQDITIASYASPDGPVDLNSNLVEGRGDNSQKFMTGKFKKAKVEGADQSDFMKRETTPDEDWEGFKNAVQQSNMADKDVILRVLSMYSDPDVREREIKNMSAVYDELRNDILPKLRRSEIIATYETRQKTQQELINMGKTTPKDLSQVELFYGAQSAEGADKETIYKNYNTQYSSDWKGFNNLGVYYIKNNQLDDAEAQLQKAEAADANNAAVINNMGVLYWAKGDYDNAAKYFKQASQIDPSDDINYNLGVICIKKGNYADAVTKFGSTPSFNKSLAQTLNSSNTDAINTLNSVKSQEAYYFYLKAVEAAKNSDDNGVFTNLKTAVQKDATIKAYASEDMEFARYFEDETFKSIIQ